MLPIPAAISQPDPAMGLAAIANIIRNTPSAMKRTAIKTARATAPPIGFSATNSPAIA